MNRRALLASGMLAGGLLFVINSSAATSQGKAILTDEQFAKFVAADAKYLNEALAQEKADKKAARKVQAAALMISACAEATNHADKTAAKFHADHLFAAASKEDWKSAKGHAAQLQPKIQAAKGAAAPANTSVAPYMFFFASETVGGFGVEQILIDLMETKDKLTDAQLARLAEIGYRTSALGKAAERFGPEKDMGMQTKKTWVAISAELQQDALGLAAAASAKNEANTRKALEKLDATCTKCHDLFK